MRLKRLAVELASHDDVGDELLQVLVEQDRQAILGGDRETACQAALDLAARLSRGGDNRTALRLLAAVHDADRPPRRLIARLTEALIRKEVGDAEGAERCMTEVMSDATGAVAAAAWYHRGCWLVDENNDSEAQEAFRKSLAEGGGPYYGLAALSLALALGRTRDLDGCRRWSMEAIGAEEPEVAWRGAASLTRVAAFQGSPPKEDLAVFHGLLHRLGTDSAFVDVRRAAAEALLAEAQSLADRHASVEALQFYELVHSRFSDDPDDRVRQLAATALLEGNALRESTDGR